MGKELGTQFYALWQEFNWLAMKWGEYEVLYGGGSMRLDLLNGSAPAFFWMVGKVLLEDMLLHISRLTDPPASGKDRDKGNLTIRNLPGFVEDATTRAALYRLVNKAGDKGWTTPWSRPTSWGFAFPKPPDVGPVRAQQGVPANSRRSLRVRGA